MTCPDTMLGAGPMKNKGFSLIEILVVMAIIAIAGTIVWMSVNTLFGVKAKQSAKYIFGALEKTKVEQMTKQGDSWIWLHTGSDGVYLDIYESGALLENEFEDGNRIGDKQVFVTYTMTGGTGTLDNDGIVLAFNRSDGSFRTVGQAWDLKAPGSPPNPNFYVLITVTSGDTSRSITLYPNTGKFEYTQ